jgi:hypothetical protein
MEKGFGRDCETKISPQMHFAEIAKCRNFAKIVA